MKQFNNIIDAINYQPHCPLCKKHLRVNERSLANEFYPVDKRMVSFYIDQRNIDYVTIDLLTNKVELNVTIDNSYNHHPSFHGGALTYVPPPPTSYVMTVDKFMHALHIECNDCCQYSFTLQVHINLKRHELIGVFLNSESITIEADDLAHEIRNVYSHNKTEYTCFGRESGERKVDLPLIEIDKTNIKETVSRIRKLLIFS